MKNDNFYTYIVCSRNGVLYIGVTNNLARRISEHKQKLVPGFSVKYNTNRLVWYEHYFRIQDAIQREKQLKRWRREKKIELIERSNPKWRDLSDDF